MKRRLLSSAIAMAITGSSRISRYRGSIFSSGPTFPESPTVNRERRCAACHVGIVSGTKCFACSKRRLK
jgi:hypothetical protein